MRTHVTGGPARLASLAIAMISACAAGPSLTTGSSSQAETELVQLPATDDKKIDLDGIDLTDQACDCAAAYLKNLQAKLREQQALLAAAKSSVTETQGYMDDLNGKIVAERAALNEIIASDIALYTGIAVDSIALVLDISVPGSAVVRRAACAAGKKMTNVMVKQTLTSIATRTTINDPVKSGLRRVAIARVVEGSTNGITEVTTWIPVVGPAVEIYQKWNGLKKRDEYMAIRKENLDSLVAEYDAKNAFLQTKMAEVQQREADVANLQSKIDSFQTSQAMCEAFAGEPEVLAELGIDPSWPKDWANVFFIKTEPRPLVCQDAWIKFTGSSRLSRFWGSRDAVNAARAQAESMCFNNPIGAVPNPVCDAGYSQQRTSFFDYQGGPNPSGDRQGAGCDAPRFYGSSTVWSDPLTEVDCWCYRNTCCGQGTTDVDAVAKVAVGLNVAN